VKRPRVTIKRNGTEIIITTADIHALFLGFAIIIVVLTAALLFVMGRTDEALSALIFASGMGSAEGLRRLFRPRVSRYRRRHY